MCLSCGLGVDCGDKFYFDQSLTELMFLSCGLGVDCGGKFYFDQSLTELCSYHVD